MATAYAFISSLPENSNYLKPIVVNNVTYYAFPKCFNQASLLQRKQSNACTLIGILLAECLCEADLKIFVTQQVQPAVVQTMTNCIYYGNILHDEQMILRHREAANPEDLGKVSANFSVPQALRPCKATFRELDFTNGRSRNPSELSNCIRAAQTFWLLLIACRQRLAALQKERGETPPVAAKLQNMTLLLICDEKTVLLTYQPAPTDRYVLIDGHSHGENCGAIIATASGDTLFGLCQFIMNDLFTRPQGRSGSHDAASFEISLLESQSHLSLEQRLQPEWAMQKLSGYELLRSPLVPVWSEPTLTCSVQWNRGEASLRFEAPAANSVRYCGGARDVANRVEEGLSNLLLHPVRVALKKHHRGRLRQLLNLGSDTTKGYLTLHSKHLSSVNFEQLVNGSLTISLDGECSTRPAVIVRRLRELELEEPARKRICRLSNASTAANDNADEDSLRQGACSAKNAISGGSRMQRPLAEIQNQLLGQHLAGVTFMDS